MTHRNPAWQVSCVPSIRGLEQHLRAVPKVCESLCQSYEQGHKRRRVIHEVMKVLGIFGQTKKPEDHVAGLGGA